MTPAQKLAETTETTAEQNRRLVDELKAKYPERVQALLARATARLEARRAEENQEEKALSDNLS